MCNDIVKLKRNKVDRFDLQEVRLSLVIPWAFYKLFWTFRQIVSLDKLLKTNQLLCFSTVSCEHTIF